MGRIIAIGIVLFWLVMVGVLVQRHFIDTKPVQLEKQYLDTYIESREEWAGIYFQNQKIGYAHSLIKRIEDGYQIIEDVLLDMAVMDVPQRIETRSTSVTDRNLSLSVFSFRLKAGIVSFIAYGNVDGNTMKLTIFSGGVKQKKSITLREVPVLENSLKYYILKYGLAPGTRFERTFFDPLTQSNRSIKVTVIGEDEIVIRGRRYACYKVRESFGGITMLSWVDKTGTTLQEQSPMGFVLVKESHEDALHAYWGDRPDITSATSIKVENAFVNKNLKRLVVRLRNVDLNGFAIESSRQEIADDTLIITRETIGPGDSYRLPFSGPDQARFLAATAMIQSDRDEIRTLASVIKGKNDDAQRAVRKLNQWVYAELEKKPTMSIPNALEVLQTRQGDCNEHAVFMAALCRAVGIPTKVCTGLVYLNGRFYYHAWVEVYLNRWVSADPTMNQLPADVTHIKFIEGDIENQMAVLRIVGQIKIEVVDYR